MKQRLMPTIIREPYDPKLLEVVLTNLRGELDRRLKKHGPGIYASEHETLGIIAEEYQEFIDACKLGDHYECRSELFDIAVTAVFGIVSSAQNYSETE